MTAHGGLPSPVSVGKLTRTGRISGRFERPHLVPKYLGMQGRPASSRRACRGDVGNHTSTGIARASVWKSVEDMLRIHHLRGINCVKSFKSQIVGKSWSPTAFLYTLGRSFQGKPGTPNCPCKVSWQIQKDPPTHKKASLARSFSSQGLERRHILS